MISNIEEIDYNWSLEVGDYTFNMIDNINIQKSLAIARILGICVDDFNCKKLIYFTTIVDGNNILDDIELITNERPIIIENIYIQLPDNFINNINNILFIELPDNFINNVNNMLNILDFKCTSLNLFLLQCPKFIIREYLSTLLCKNIKINMNTIIYNSIEMYNYPDNYIKIDINYIKQLLNKLNIETTDIILCEKKLGKTRFYNDIDVCDNDDVIFTFSFQIKSYEIFRKNINLKYYI